MGYENILTEKVDGAFIVTINREKKMNVLDKKTITEIGEALEEGEKDREIRAIIFTGAGEKAFVAGADISEFADHSASEARKMSEDGQTVFDRVERSSKPVIAAINGFALGGGLELAMACHIRVASENAKMGLPEVTLGVIPAYGGTQRLPRLIGRGKATELITTAQKIGAEEAKELRLVEYVVPQEEVLETCKGSSRALQRLLLLQYPRLYIL